jgi:hypothetical protein
LTVAQRLAAVRQVLAAGVNLMLINGLAFDVNAFDLYGVCSTSS